MDFARRLVQLLKRHATWLKWVCAVALLGFLFYRYEDELRTLGERSIDWRFAALGLVLCAAALVLTFLRWYLLVWGQGFAFRISDAMRIGFIGYLFNYVAPGAVGGDLVKALIIAREQRSRRFVAIATVLLDRVLGLIGLFLVGAAAGLLPTPISQRPAMQSVFITFALAGAGGLAAVGMVLLPGVPRSRLLTRLVRVKVVGRLIGEFVNSVVLYQSRRRIVAAAVAISIPGHLLMLSSFYCIARALHAKDAVPSYAEHLQFIPAAELVGVLVPLPGGIGALEEAVAYYYEFAGASRGDGFLTGIGYRAVTIVIALVGSGYYLANRREVGAVIDEAEDVAAGSAPPQDS